MKNTVLSHIASGSLAALLGSGATYVALRTPPNEAEPAESMAAQAPATTVAESLQTVLFETTMDDVLRRAVPR